MRFYLNLEKFYALCQLRGWKYPVSDLARETGFAKSYISRVVSGKEELTHRFMLAYIKACGISAGHTYEWATLFVIAPNDGVMDMQRLNYEKFYGRVPYSKNSLTYDFRKETDSGLEIER